MQSLVTVLGIIIKSEASSDYDRRLVILTRELGKITVFAKGARRPNNRFISTTTPFCFGEFVLFPGRNAYSLSDSNISCFFKEVREDYETSLFGMYFLELADYYTKEGKDDAAVLKLLYQSLKALSKPELSKRFVKAIYEIKMIMLNGEFRGVPEAGELQGIQKVIRYLWEERPEKVYSFLLSDELWKELIAVADRARKEVIDRPMNTLLLLEELENI